MKFLLGIFAGFAILGLVVSAFVLSGSFDVAARTPIGKFEKRLAGFALDRAVARRAPKVSNPLAPSKEVLSGGLEQFEEMCVTCHGAPGVEPSEIGVGLNPPAPDLTLARVQARSDGQLFWLVSNGVRMSGMPAFGPTHKEEEIWKIVAFMRHLPSLTPEEEKQLKAGAAEHEHGDEQEPGGEKDKGHTHEGEHAHESH
jgi:mono/diheme cytochrome c family protein